MAIINFLQVSIEVAGQELQEYEHDDGQIAYPNTAVKYIEAMSESEFQIRTRVPSAFRFDSDSIRFELDLDGRQKTWFYPPRERSQGQTQDWNGLYKELTMKNNAARYGRSLKFTEIDQYTSTDLLQDTFESNIGSVIISVFRVMECSKDDADKIKAEKWKHLDERIAATEKELKGQSLSHCVQVGPKVPCGPPTGRNYKYKDGPRSPIAVFHFKYRSKKILQDLQIVPRSPPPPPPMPLEQRPRNTLSVEELRDLVDRFEARNREMAKRFQSETSKTATCTKRNSVHNPTSSDKRQEVVQFCKNLERKREEDDIEIVDARRVKRSRIDKNTEVIDLTEDGPGEAWTLVNIVVNEQDLHEYDDDDNPDSEGLHNVTKYVEAISGANFATGVPIDSALYRRESSGQVTNLHGSRTYKQGIYSLRKLQFSEIEITEELPSSNNEQDLDTLRKHLGTIMVNVLRVKNFGIEQKPTARTELPSGGIPEKLLKGKALSHRASVSSSETIKPYTAVYCDKLDSDSNPFAVFTFKYRSRKALQALYIIPKSPTPILLEDRPIEQLSHAEALELLRRRSAVTQSKVKDETQERLDVETAQGERNHARQGRTANDEQHEAQERSGTSRDKRLKRVKRERGPEYDNLLASARQSKTSRKIKPEVVDLTID